MELQKKDKYGRKKNIGKIEIRNSTETAADLCFYGDINSESMGAGQKYFPDDKAPKDVQDFLAQLDGVSKINVHINSGGGSVFGGIAIYNILKNHKAEVTVYVEGIAASIASVIAMAGDRIIIPENAQMMVHKPHGYTRGNADDMRKMAEVLDNCQKTILNVYMQRVKEGITEEEINALINAETWKNGKEWQEYFDIETSESINAAACASDYFDEYKNLPAFLENEEPQNDTDEIAKKVAEKVAEYIGEKITAENNNEKAKTENEKTKILNDLEYFV